MLICPFCENLLTEKSFGKWNCECGEAIPFGFEKDDDENCRICAVQNCPRRK